MRYGLQERLNTCNGRLKKITCLTFFDDMKNFQMKIPIKINNEIVANQQFVRFLIVLLLLKAFLFRELKIGRNFVFERPSVLFLKIFFSLFTQNQVPQIIIGLAPLVYHSKAL